MNSEEAAADIRLNKDLILREHLAIERTRMANQRTLLSFLRTGLYFLVAGSTLGQFVNTTFWKYMGIPFIITGVVIVVIGMVDYVRGRKKLSRSRKQIGNVANDFIMSVTGRSS